MSRLSPLLIAMFLLASLMAHPAHGSLPEPAAAPAAAVVAAEHADHEVKTLRVVHHGAVDDIVPELCTIGDPVPPSPSLLQGHVEALATAAGSAALATEPRFTAIGEEPVYPADVLRALLQVFLN